MELTAFDIREGTDEQVLKADGNHRRGIRMGVFSATSYGEGAEDWLTQANMLTDKNNGLLAIVSNDNASLDISDVYGEEIELRYLKSWDIRYAIEYATPNTTERVPVEIIDIDLIQKGTPSPPDLLIAIDEDWS